VISAAAPPSSRPARGPAASASQPTSGAPIGVEPRNTTEYSAITRPRSAGPAPSCSDELTPAAKVTLAMPSGTSASAWSVSVGASAASSWAAPKSAAETVSSPGPVRLRAPAASAPRTEPMPIALVSSA
jgi:hypothetical protein